MLGKEPRPILAGTTELSGKVIDAALAVHRHLGPGLLESIYERCLVHELRQRNVDVKTQVGVPLSYRGMVLDGELRVDLLVGDSVIVEVKATESLPYIHTAQLLTYLKLTGVRVGLLINFNVPLLRDGIRRIVL